VEDAESGRSQRLEGLTPRAGLLRYRRVRHENRKVRSAEQPLVATATPHWNLLLGVALLALIVRLVYIWQISQAPFFTLRIGDADAYHQWALRIVAGDWIGDGVFYQAPLYPYFLAVVYSMLGDGVAMVRFVQAVIGAGACTLLAAGGTALFGPRGAIAGVLLAIYPAAILLDGLLEKTALVGFFTAALLYLLSVKPARLHALLAGVVLGLLSLTRENALLLGLPALLWLLSRERQRTDDAALTRRGSWPAAVAFVGGCALILLPIGARNYAVGGEFHLITSQFGPNFYIGNHAGATGLYDALVPGHGSVADERADATQLAEQATERRLSPAEVSSFWAARAFEFIRTHPAEWIGQLGRKLALTFNAGEIADTESQEVYAEWSSLLRVLAPFSFAVVFGLAAFGACLTAKSWRQFWFLHAVVLTCTLSIVMFYVFARYRFPLVPGLLLLAAAGFAAWREKAARPMRRWALTVAAIAAGLAYLPLYDARADRVAHDVSIANAFLTEAGKWDQAAVFYDKALNESPRSPAAHFGRATLMRLRNRSQDALVHFRVAVDGWPDNADLRLNYAQALTDAGEHQSALDQLSAATSLRPADPISHYLAGQVLMTTGRLEEAKQKLERALELSPGSPDIQSALQRTNDLLEPQVETAR
jgi:tetratricopeptide (TPR) repeat protein